jgi:uncharacterized protein YjbK
MQQNLEIEVKSLVNEEQFKVICEYFKVNSDEFKVQTNHYFDTINQKILKIHHSALRIREVSDKYLLTFKVKQINGINELEYQIDKETFKQLIDGTVSLKGHFDEIFKNFKIKPEDVIYISSLTTKRFSLPYLNGEIFLDINYYNNKCDYEIEYETSSYDYGNNVLTELFSKLGFDYIPNLISKRERATKKE